MSHGYNSEKKHGMSRHGMQMGASGYGTSHGVSQKWINKKVDNFMRNNTAGGGNAAGIQHSRERAAAEVNYALRGFGHAGTKTSAKVKAKADAARSRNRKSVFGI